MTNPYATCFAILLYKNKLLLMLPDDNPQLEKPNVWSFIGGEVKKSSSAVETMKRTVAASTGITLKKVEELVVLEANGSKHVGYVSVISDHDVNIMKPASDRQHLGFFTLNDMKKIHLSELPKQFIAEHTSIFQTLTV